jgi:hypothetical protein
VALGGPFTRVSSARRRQQFHGLGQPPELGGAFEYGRCLGAREAGGVEFLELPPEPLGSCLEDIEHPESMVQGYISTIERHFYDMDLADGGLRTYVRLLTFEWVAGW